MRPIARYLTLWIGIFAAWLIVLYGAEASGQAAAPGPAGEAILRGEPHFAEPPDLVDRTSESIDLAKTVWQRGGWQFAVVMLWLIAAAFYKRMEPADKDGDGKPDLTGWRGRTWAVTGAALMLLGPLAALAMGADGAAWSGVLVAVPPALAALLVPFNPVRGAARPTP